MAWLSQTGWVSEPEGVSKPHSAERWDERYSGEPVWSGRPNEALVVEAEGLTPGRALDVGCGEGADAVWLARRGWRVTALDISPKAVERTEVKAAEAGVHVVGIAAGLLEAALPDASFDLISAMYPALLRTATCDAERRLLDLVAPGGTLLVVHHADVDRDHPLAHGCDPDEYVSPDDVRAIAVGRGDWDVVVSERRERSVSQGAGAHHHKDDLVLRLHRL